MTRLENIQVTYNSVESYGNKNKNKNQIQYNNTM